MGNHTHPAVTFGLFLQLDCSAHKQESSLMVGFHAGLPNLALEAPADNNVAVVMKRLDYTQNCSHRKEPQLHAE